MTSRRCCQDHSYTWVFTACFSNADPCNNCVFSIEHHLLKIVSIGSRVRLCSSDHGRVPFQSAAFLSCPSLITQPCDIGICPLLPTISVFTGFYWWQLPSPEQLIRDQNCVIVCFPPKSTLILTANDT